MTMTTNVNTAHDLASVTRQLKEHIEGEILLRKAPLGLHEDMFDAGFDSMSLTRLLVFVEERFGVAIPEHEVVLDEVSTVDKMARFVHERVASAGK